MDLRTVLTVAVFAACLRPAVAMVTDVPLAPVDGATPPSSAQVYVISGGLRGARPDDDPGLVVFNAAGNSLLFTLEKWRAAAGAIDIAPQTEGAGDRVTLNLRRLIAFGHYSVFLRTDAADGAHYAPLDASGIGNNFDARQDGSATVSVDAPQHVSSGSWIVTIYHSDAQDHGNSPGDFSRTAHQQLIVKIP